MLELKTHDEFFEFSHNSVHKLLVPKEIISQLEADFTSIGNFPEIVKDPYILFALQPNQMKEIYLYEADKDNKVGFDALVVAIHNAGLDFLIQRGDRTIIFPVFSISKGYKFNSSFFKELFTKKPKANPKDSMDIIPNGKYRLRVDDDVYDNVSFKIIIEASVFTKLFEFYENYKNIWQELPFRKYRNLIIYFNKDFVENGILFEILNFSHTADFHLNFIQNRLFFITEIDNKLKLFMNDMVITHRDENKNIDLEPLDLDPFIKQDILPIFSTDDKEIKISRQLVTFWCFFMIKFCFLSQNSKIYIIILQIYFFRRKIWNREIM